VADKNFEDSLQDRKASSDSSDDDIYSQAEENGTDSGLTLAPSYGDRKSLDDIKKSQDSLFKGVNKNVDDLKKTVSDVTESLDDLKGSVSDVSKELDKLAKDVGEHRKEILSKLDSTVKDLNSKFKDVDFSKVKRESEDEVSSKRAVVDEYRKSIEEFRKARRTLRTNGEGEGKPRETNTISQDIRRLRESTTGLFKRYTGSKVLHEQPVSKIKTGYSTSEKSSRLASSALREFANIGADIKRDLYAGVFGPFASLIHPLEKLAVGKIVELTKGKKENAGDEDKKTAGGKTVGSKRSSLYDNLIDRNKKEPETTSSKTEGSKVSGIFSEGGLFGKKNDFLLKDAKLIQERDAKLKADKVYIDAKSVLGGAGAGSVFDTFSGKGGAFSKITGWLVGGGWKKLGLVGLALGSIGTAISGYQEGGIGLGASKGIGTFAGGLAGAKLGAIGGAAIGSVIPVVGTALGGAVGGALGGIAGMFAGDKIATGIYKGMKKLISDKDWVGSLKSGFGDAVSWLGGTLSSLVDAVKNGMKWVGDKTKGIVETVKGGVEKAIAWVGGKIPESIKGPAKALFHSLAKFVSPEDAYALTTIAGTESSLNAKAKAGTSDASGAFQFTSGTWRAYSKRAGVTAVSPTTASLEEQAKVAAEYLKDVKGSLAKQGLKSYNTTDLKMGWFFGPDRGAKITKIAKENPSMTIDELVKTGLISRQDIVSNPGVFNKTVKTVGDLYGYFDKDVKKWQVAVSGAVDTQDKITKELPKQLDTVKDQTVLAKEIGGNQLQENKVRNSLVTSLNDNFNTVKEQANIQDESLTVSKTANQSLVKGNNALSSVLSSATGMVGNVNRFAGSLISTVGKNDIAGKVGSIVDDINKFAGSNQLGNVGNAFSGIASNTGVLNNLVNGVISKFGKGDILGNAGSVVGNFSKFAGSSNQLGGILSGVTGKVGGGEILSKAGSLISGGIVDTISSLFSGPTVGGNVKSGMPILGDNGINTPAQSNLLGDVSSVSKGLLDAEVGKQSIFTDAIDGIKNVVGSIVGKKQGGMAGLTAGGDEFKKVPLMVEDLGLLALQLGLV
jgi:ElaB/YqjD/DUF883 family membrane-anchored ribosome-binding protein